MRGKTEHWDRQLTTGTRPSAYLGLVVLACVVGLLVLFTCVSCTISGSRGELSARGTVINEEGLPLAGAVVRVQATSNETTTGPDGAFVLEGLGAGEPVNITAWAAGYYISVVERVAPGTDNISLTLRAHSDNDNSEYAWLPSVPPVDKELGQGCSQCHSAAGTELSFALPVDEWLLDAHSQSAANPRFLTMYSGTDLEGHQSPQTRFAYNRDYGSFPLPPDPGQPYYGPGYKLDFPDTAGNCAACHTPVAAVNDAYGTDPTLLSGVEKEGIPCDFCHKVWDVHLDEVTGLPAENMPGVLSFEFRRPPDGHQFFAGPFDDVAPGEDTYSPLQAQSQFCAPCHFGVFWNTVVYNSFGEWLASPYSDPETGRTCQDCHMPSQEVAYFARPDRGGRARQPETIFSHLMPGASAETLLQNTVTMGVEVDRKGGQVVVDVSLTNDQAGHHVPTDSPLRQLILLVSATDSGGQALPLVEGPTLSELAGVGDPAQGYYSGLPGKVYAKVLGELWTGVVPTGAYWNPTRVVSDNRLAAMETDETVYRFDGSGPGEVNVSVTLFYRRAFKELMDQKGWDVPDIVMEEERVVVR